MSPTQRTLAECKKRGWIAQVVERFNSFTKRRHDLFGCIDIVAITPTGIMGIQATSGTNHSSRIAKAEQEPQIAAWLGAGAQFEVWSWAKRGERGKRKRWTLRASGVSRSVSQ
jgi:hypothetical protein